MFEKKLEKIRVFDEDWEVVDQYGCMLLQVPSFTYLGIGCYDDQSFILLRCPSDKTVLMELARQIVVVHEK